MSFSSLFSWFDLKGIWVWKGGVRERFGGFGVGFANLRSTIGMQDERGQKN